MFKIFSILTISGLLSISAAYAQSEQPIQAKVPFAFVVQNTTLPAGNYQLIYSNTAHSISIRGLDQNSSAAFVTAEPTADSGPTARQGRLMFHCYGKTCYLAQVWAGAVGGDRGLKVRQTKHERTSPVATRVVAVTIPAK